MFGEYHKAPKSRCILRNIFRRLVVHTVVQLSAQNQLATTSRKQGVTTMKPMTETEPTWRNPIRCLGRFVEQHFHHRGHLDRGIDDLHANLGIIANAARSREEHPLTVTVPSTSLRRPVIYAPDMDGHVDSGEVVWYRIVRTKDADPELRACLIIGRNEHTLLGMLISSNPEHRNDDNWLPIGTGLWDPRGNKCWVRIDKIVEIPEARIQRRGVSMPERRFDRIASELRVRHNWS